MADDIDRAQAAEQRDRAIALASRRGVDLGEIVIRAGQRHCCVCDDPIPAARILAQPSAGRCVACQSDYEREIALYGDR